MKKYLWILICAMSAFMFIGCGNQKADVISEDITDEQAVEAIQNYCYQENPELEDLVKKGEYPIYWDVYSSDDEEVVIVYRSYTAAQRRYYIDRSTGETSVTELIPGLTDEEPTDEKFNVREFL